ncbi:BspA family leucine-rich repeat surface protein [uncultured Adlercreutzia sp.]|uniref:BspA family leucine-rich repeat surface protein n=1 Tax=uncultured Adlercreutzia sp. TaxID=875803 RepID=UPI0025E5602A|nr:BspA family leucine-rich repeat surface protein [uncultured Adlercreutzia sp.]
MEKANEEHQEKNRGLLFAVTMLLCVVGLFAAVLDYDKAWADDSKGPYAMIYKNPGSYTYTLVFQNDNTPDARYGTLAEEHDEVICDSQNPDEWCTCWSASWTNLDITKVVVRDPMSPHNMDCWFWYLENLESVDLAKLDTSQVHDMSYMFTGCDKLKTLNLSNFNTANVTNFSHMFSSCDALTSVNVSSFNTSKATDMSYMFASCNELATLDISSFDMRNVLDATSMFPSDWGKLATVKVGANGNVRTLLPTPDRYYIEGATGKWVGASGAAYASSSIPSFKADTYKAQRGYSVANLTTSLSKYYFDYTGSAIKPAVSVKLSYDTPLKQGKDYTVSYSSNVNAGKATVTIKGMGNYGGTATETFTIYPLSISSSNVAKIPIQDYTGKALKPVPTVKVGGKTLKAGRDFTVKYYSNKKVGTAMVYIAGKGNYSSSCYAYFTIAKRAKQPMTVKANAKKAKAKTLKKKAVALSKTVTVKKAKGKVTYKNVSTQKAAKKFKVNEKTGKITLSKGTKKGTYKVKIKATAAGNSSYKAGSKTVTVKVVVK